MNIFNQPYTNSTFLNFIVGLILTAVSIAYILNRLSTHGSTSEFQFAGPLLIMGLISFWASSFNNLKGLQATDLFLAIYNLGMAIVCFFFIKTNVEWVLSTFFANTFEEVTLHVILAFIFFTLALLGRSERHKTYL